MSKTVLSVGQCGPDHSAISGFLRREFGCEVDTAATKNEALEKLRSGSDYAVVLVNRKLDADYSDGLAIIQAAKSEDELKSVPIMLVSNYADAQEAAVAEGAVEGFGKAELSAPATKEKLQVYLADA